MVALDNSTASRLPVRLPAAGHKAVRLGPQQQHTISVALSSTDCSSRAQECGILQQLLLLVFAAAPHTRTAQALADIAGVAAADCPAEWAAAGVAAASAVAAAGPAFRLFVVARRVTVALVHRPAELASLLDAEAKPYIAGALTACMITFFRSPDVGCPCRLRP